MTIHLWEYLGFAGIASVLLTVVALAMIPASLILRASLRMAATGLLCAALAVLLAGSSANRLSRIAVLPTEAELAERQRQEEVREREYQRIRQRAGGLRFAEDAPGDELDPAGLRTQAEREILERRRSEPAYRQQGRQQRIGPDGEVIADPDQPGTSPEAEPARAMTAEALREARQWTGINRRVARGTFALLALFFFWDYLRRLNRFNREVWPLPLTGQWLESLEPRDLHPTLSFVPGISPSKALSDVVINCLQKGEQVLMLGLPDPCPGSPAQSRLPWIGMDWMLVPKWTLPTAASEDDISVCLEAVWHGQAWALVPEWEEARRMIDCLPQWFSWREKTGARARTTLNLFLPSNLIPGTAKQTLTARANALGIRIVEVTP